HHLLEQIKAPIYATPLTRGLVELKLSRGGLLSQVTLNTVKAGENAQIGPFSVDFFHVCHSIPDGVGLGIDTPAGLVIHSGDFKFDHTPVDSWPTDYAKLGEFSGRGVLVLMADSTNADKRGWTPSERVIEPALDQVFRTAPGRIIVATFASVISRMQQVANAAIAHGRKMTFVGTSMNENARISRKLGYLEIPDKLLVSVEQALKMKPNEIVLMCTGSQGEPSSILGRLSTGTNRQFDLVSGDTVVLSSHPIPGNEESVHKTINRLFRRGASVIYDAIAPVHVSGHASQEEEKLLINLVKPRHFIPIHGELRHLHQHADLARELGIPADRVATIENGHSIEFDDGVMRLGERVPGGYVFVDGAGVGDIGPGVVREREALARDGIVLVNLKIDHQTYQLREEPEIITRGFIVTRDADQLIAGMNKLIGETIRRGNGDLKETLRTTLMGYIYNETKRRPMIFITTSKE
ncbi:MAG: ribonuclease J, partial [Anaerolineae bacterium]|nr:ribonuclease J [Anaerolineae bacterium]